MTEYGERKFVKKFLALFLINFIFYSFCLFTSPMSSINRASTPPPQQIEYMYHLTSY